jgi:hypothetical protein
MTHKGHWGEYTGNAKWSRDHARTKVTKENYDASERDNAAHVDYLERDVKDDQRAGGKYKDENQTADEKHISKLEGDMKYDKEHHGLSRKRSDRLRKRAMKRSERTGAEWGDYDYEDKRVQKMLSKARELDERSGEKTAKDQERILMKGKWGS